MLSVSLARMVSFSAAAVTAGGAACEAVVLGPLTCGALARAQMVDQAVGGAVVADNFLAGAEFRKDDLCKLLAKFDAPLVEAVDVPDNALREDLVLVERDEPPQRVRSELVVQDGGRRAVAFE